MISEPIIIRVPAVPVAQPRMRATVRSGHAAVYTPNTIKSSDGSRKPHPIHLFKATVRLAAAAAFTGEPIAGAVRVDVEAVFPRPASKIWKTKPMPRYPHITKPDRDNLDKAVLDALKGIVLRDDCIAWDGRITKEVAAGGEQPGVVITIH